MPKDAGSRDLMTDVAPRVVDLRAEFEAQLRAVTHIEEQLAKTLAGKDPTQRDLRTVVTRELAEMLRNNTNIRDVLADFDGDVRVTGRPAGAKGNGAGT